jgi:hypothetical protein
MYPYVYLDGSHHNSEDYGYMGHVLDNVSFSASLVHIRSDNIPTTGRSAMGGVSENIERRESGWLAHDEMLHKNPRRWFKGIPNAEDISYNIRHYWL